MTGCSVLIVGLNGKYKVDLGVGHKATNRCKDNDVKMSAELRGNSNEAGSWRYRIRSFVRSFVW